LHELSVKQNGRTGTHVATPDYIRPATGRLEIQEAAQVGDDWCG
jgi:hypothetical protein